MFNDQLENWIGDILDFSEKWSLGLSVLKNLDQVKIGISKKTPIYREGKLVLYHYQPQVTTLLSTPVLIVFSLINRPDILDLTEDYSMIKRLLQSGIDVYLIDWGYPDSSDATLTLTDYVAVFLKNCVHQILMRSQKAQINLLGVCQGGVLSLCYSALYPKQIKNLITMVTPVDFHTPDNLLSKLLQEVDIDLMVNVFGNIPGYWLASLFKSLKPFQLLGKKYLDFMDILDNDKSVQRFLAMEKWILDTPDQAGEAFRNFTKEFYQKNSLVKGEIILANRRVNLKELTMPILNIIAQQDYLVPPSASHALEQCTGSSDYSRICLSGGHIGLYVSSKTQSQLAPAVSQWLFQHA